MRNEAKSDLNKCCAFTGHRPHKLPWKDNEDDPRCIALKKILTEQITALAEAGITDYFSGMADGTDHCCARIVLTLREKNPALKLHCLLPHEGQENKWSDSARKRYHSILKQADFVEYVSRDYYDGCMIARNHCLVDSAGLLLAVYSGARRSGTGSTVNYARKLGRNIIVIDPVTRQISYIAQDKKSERD
ncbi:MAG: DUF1273 domain-containing protein [Oscillibacter sp.]|nr:DUF1273 domain-containing protein [Oscillibacter sp.]